MSAKCAMLDALVLLLAGCSRSPAPASTPRVEPAPSAAAPDAEARVAPAEDEQLPVPEAVAKLHRSAFEPTAVEAKLGRVICLITLHDAALQRGDFYPLVLFAGGSVGTWRQTPTGGEEPFYAKLSPEELARASEFVEAIPQGRAVAREKFDASALVFGVSTRLVEHVETLYFDNERSPAALSQLVGMLKQRLEAMNRPP